MTAGLVAATVNTAVAGSVSPTTQLYADPHSAVVTWVNANPNDSRTPVIKTRIASQAQGIWFSQWSPTTVTNDVHTIVTAAGTKVPVLVVYEIPNRDCGGASAGGAPDIASYRQYVSNFAAGLGSAKALVILEPDSVALQTCVSGQALTDRNSALAYAGQVMHADDPNVKVYYDGGHSAWNSATDQANRLIAAGIKTSGDGFFTNVSNFNTTASEASYGRSVLAVLNSANLHQVIDTSRNGNGPAGSQWCDPSGRQIGTYPTTNTGDANIDAYLWVKPPGEADGCAAAAGTFVPDIAYQLAVNAADPSAPPTASPSTSPSISPSATASPRPSVTPTPTPTPTPTTTPTPSSPPPSAGCKVGYSVSDWGGGFTATVTITNTGTTPINAWTLRFTFGGNQQITNSWSATWAQSGAAVSAASLSYNAVLAPQAAAQIGFNGSYTGSNPRPSAFTLNGSTCTNG
jgi:endoglucanase